MPVSLESVNLYLDRDKSLIALKGKRPATKGNWRIQQPSKKSILDYRTRYDAFGWVLGSTDLVIDVDPRNGGDRSFLQLLGDYPELDLERCERVHTGGGGQHVYLRIPEGIRIAPHVEAYPGIDFLGAGRYVVTAGSLHPSGQRYRYQPPMREPAIVDCPGTLLALIKTSSTTSTEPPQTAQDVDVATPASRVGSVSVEALRGVLEALDPTQLGNYDDWLGVLASCHHLTGGDPAMRQACADWSAGDPKYASEAHRSVELRWDGLAREVGPRRGLASLLALCDAQGVPQEVVAPLRIHYARRYVDLLTAVDTSESDEPETAEEIEALADKLTHDSKDTEIDAVLVRAMQHEGGFAEDIAARIDRAIGSTRNWAKTRLTEMWPFLAEERLRKDADTGDLSSVVALHWLQNRVRGMWSFVQVEGQWYFWAGQYWRSISASEVKDKIRRSASTVSARLVCEGAMKKTPELNLLTERAYRAAESACAVPGQWPSTPPAARYAIPMADCVLDVREGQPLSRKARPWDWHRYALPVAYAPSVGEKGCANWEGSTYQRAALYDRTIREILRSDQELIAYLEELLGCAMLSAPPEPYFIMLIGGGANGKSLVVNLLRHILGPRCAVSVNLGALDQDRHPHALAPLDGALAAIDEDVSVGDQLPDGALKKLSEATIIRVNPKFQQEYHVVNTATPVIVANQYPRLRDFSHGMERRAQIVEFTRVFRRHERDVHRLERIVAEGLGGVVERWASGAARALRRGHFARPAAGEAALERWLARCSSVIAYMQLEIVSYPGRNIPMGQLYKQYEAWLDSRGTEKKNNYNSFEQTILERGWKIAGGELVDADFGATSGLSDVTA